MAAGRRASAITGLVLSSSQRTTREPTRPVAPVTATVIDSAARGAAFGDRSPSGGGYQLPWDSPVRVRVATGSGGTASSVVQGRQVELAQPLGVGEDIDGDDLPVGDGEAKDDPRPPAGRPHRSHGPIHQR